MGILEEATLQFETSTACNGRCTFCRHDTMKRHGTMPLTRIIDLTYHLAHKAKQVCPFHMQEPLLDPRIDKILSNVKVFNPRCHSVLYTNMSIYPERQLENIIRWGLVDTWMISLYGQDKQQHDKMQPGVPYEAAVENTKRFIKLRNRWGFASPSIRVTYLITPETLEGTRKFKRDWTGVADMAVFCRYDSWCGAYPYDEAFEAKVWGPPDPRVPCRELWNATVHYDGTVVPCCLDCDNSMPLGNVFKDWNVWQNNKVLEDLRKKHVEGRWDEIPMCRKCTKYRYNHSQEWIRLWKEQKEKALEQTLAASAVSR